jgi:diguanylate cyclase (GGDEF)-like protein
MGGDEFVLILPASKREDLRIRIAELANIGAQAAVVGLTMSVGEAFYPQDGDDAEQLLAEADRRMYTNKQAEKQKREEALEEFDADALVLAE